MISPKTKGTGKNLLEITEAGNRTEKVPQRQDQDTSGTRTAELRRQKARDKKRPIANPKKLCSRPKKESSRAGKTKRVLTVPDDFIIQRCEKEWNGEPSDYNHPEHRQEEKRTGFQGTRLLLSAHKESKPKKEGHSEEDRAQ